MDNSKVIINPLKSWLEVSPDSDFPIQNLPFGIFRKGMGRPHAATRIGDMVIDLFALSEQGFLDGLGIDSGVFDSSSLNRFIRLGKPFWQSMRSRIGLIFDENNADSNNRIGSSHDVLFNAPSVQMLLPVEVGDYTDFYSSMEHASNVGRMFRDPANALLPNWKHLPVGYHGRSSSIVVSGTDIHHPKGQFVPGGSDVPVYGPSAEVDFELEVAFITGKETLLGSSVSTYDAEEHIFGMVLFNDLSARDVQKWEYVPLGPFLAKSFGSVVSPWVVTMDALEPFRTAGPVQFPKVLPYLQFEGDHNFDVQLEVYLQPEGGSEHIVCQTNLKNIYWNLLQQLAHQTVNGCNIRVGDMYASGCISGSTPSSFGSLLEIAWQGSKPVKLPDGSERSYLHDHDTVIMRGHCEKPGLRIGFGEVRTKILPSV